jgi:hypothetical protein
MVGMESLVRMACDNLAWLAWAWLYVVRRRALVLGALELAGLVVAR